MSEEAKKWSQQYTLEKFEDAIQEVLLNRYEEIILQTESFPRLPLGMG